MNCFLSRNYKGMNSAGNKAKVDIEIIMEGLGYKNVGLPRSFSNNSVVAFLKTLLGVLKVFFVLRRGDNLVLQYPLKKYYAFVCRMAHLRGAKVITIIHYLGSFRRKALTPAKEVARLNNSDCIIAHNESMKQWLAQNGCKAALLTLGVFDYLSATSAREKELPAKPFEVLYAGALTKRKNTFLYEWGGHISSFNLNLYGLGFQPEEAKGAERFDYKGYVQSDELIATACGDFGLVWDGFSIEECTGDFGEYLQYNNPHKTSLYIRCELPVIIWGKAALAPFVKENNIGFSISSLTDLNEILSKLTVEEYAVMKENVKKMSARLAGGYYVSTALAKAVEVLGA